MEAKCSFSAIVGDSCTYERRDKAKKTEVIPLLYCTREIAGHKSTWGISDVETEVDLILARAAVFTFPENIGQFTICPYHRSSLGTGWRRGSQRCQVPEKLSGHSEDRRWPKAERGLGKRGGKMIHQRTGVFVAVGSGVCRNCRILLSKLDCEAKSTTESREALAEELSDKTEVLVPMENLTISGPRSQAPVAASTPFQLHRDDIEKDASESILSIQLDASYDDTWNLTENVSTSTVVNAPNSLALLNTFLESRDVSPIRYTLRTPWDEASERTKRQHVRKAREAVSAVLSEVAPEEPSQLWHALSESQETKRLFKVDAERRSATTDDSLLEALATCYNNADQWDTRRQILSIMADKASFAKIQEWIPGLTRYRFTVARQHILLHGRGAPVPPPSSRTRMVVPEEKLAHFLDFITSPHIIQDLPFGEKVVTLSTKEVIKIPNVVRNTIPERIVQQYQAYSKESGFTPMSRSTLLRILEVCTASTRKSLQGIDYISSAGAEAFDILGGVADRLGEMNMGMSWAKEQKEHLKKCKRYLKTDYKLSFASDHTDSSQVIDEELSSLLENHFKNLKIGHVNINSVGGFKFFELKALMLKGLFDVMVVSETKVDNAYPDSQFYIKGFRLYRKDRNRHGGGLFIYVKRELLVNRVSDLEGAKIESIVLTIQTSRSSKKLLIIGAYRPPSVPKTTWEPELNNILLRASQRFEGILLIGDLNCDLSDCNKGAKEGQALMDLADVYGLSNLIKVPTRVTADSSSLIDVALTNNTRSFVSSGAFDLGLSDHHLIYTVMRTYSPRSSPRTVTARRFKHYDPELFAADVNMVPFHIAHLFDDPEDVSWAWGKLLEGVLDAHAPIKTTKIRREHVPFMTPELLAAIRKRNKLRRRYFATRDSGDLENYKVQRNATSSLRRKLISSYLRTKASDAQGDPKQFWRTIKPFMHSRRNTSNEAIQLKENGSLVRDNKEVAEIFNHYYSLVQNVSDVPTTTVEDFRDHPSIRAIMANCPVTDQFHFSHVNSAELETILKSLNVNKATGHDSVPARALRDCASALL
ncbi:hypothetical protein ACROYT_G024801 [Oculina patagonica]